MEFKDKIVVVTGGASGIGKTICDEFQKEGATVCIIDKEPPTRACKCELMEPDSWGDSGGEHRVAKSRSDDAGRCATGAFSNNKNHYFVGDIADEDTLHAFANRVIATYGRVDCLINNAMLSRGGINNCSYTDFNYVLRVGVSAPFMLAKLFANYFTKGASIVNISSSRDRMSQPNTESYTAAKGGITALTHALAVSLAGQVRVNSVSPGWIDTEFRTYDGADAKQHPAGRVGNPLDVANMVLYLCSERAGFITGENICIDGGMTKQMIYHNDFGWSLTL